MKINPKAIIAVSLCISSTAALCQEVLRDTVYISGKTGPLLVAPGAASGGMHSFTAPTKSAPTPTRRPSSAGSSNRQSSGGSSSSGRSSSSRGGRSYSSKDAGNYSAKDALILPEEPTVTWSIQAGYQSEYIRGGIDRLALTNLFNGGSSVGMYYAGVNLNWKNLGFGYKYIQGEDGINPLFLPTFREVTYEEHVIDVNYTLFFGARDQFNATIGYSGSFYPDEAFWNTDAEHQYYAKLSWAASTLFQPSVRYSYFNQSDAITTNTIAPGLELLERQEVVFRVDGALEPIEFGRTALGVQYYAEYGYADWDQFADTQSWWQVGLALPFALSESFVLTPTVNYTDSDFSFADSPEFWWGVRLSYTF